MTRWKRIATRIGFGGGFSILLGASFSSTARADFFTHRWENQHEAPSSFRLAPELSYYSSGANYRTDGEVKAPGTLDSYDRTQMDLTGAYGLTPELTAYARITWASVGVSDINRTNIPSTSGLVDQTLGLNYRILNSRDLSGQTTFTLDLQGQVDIPAYDNAAATSSGVLLLGDETTDLTLGVFGGLPFSHGSDAFWEVRGGLGYTARSDSKPAGMPWTLELRRQAIAKGITLAAGLWGYQTVGGTDDGRIITGSVGANGSFIVNSPRPSHTSIRGLVGYEFSPKAGAWLAASSTIAGKAAPEAYQLSVGATLRFGEVAETTQVTEETTREFAKPNRGFVQYGMEAKVLKSNDRMNLVKIDKGAEEGVAVGQIFDVFSVKQDGSVEGAVARAKVSSVRANEAVLQVVEYYREVWIDEGFVAKRPL